MVSGAINAAVRVCISACLTSTAPSASASASGTSTQSFCFAHSGGPGHDCAMNMRAIKPPENAWENIQEDFEQQILPNGFRLSNYIHPPLRVRKIELVCLTAVLFQLSTDRQSLISICMLGSYVVVACVEIGRTGAH